MAVIQPQIPGLTRGLPQLPRLTADLGGFVSGGGGAGGGGFGGGGIFDPPGTISIGGGNGPGGTGTPTGGTSTSVGWFGSTAAGAAASAAGWLLGVDWGRIAAFLLGLLLIAGGIYLIPKVKQTINVTVGRGIRAAGRAAAEAAAE